MNPDRQSTAWKYQGAADDISLEFDTIELPFSSNPADDISLEFDTIELPFKQSGQ